jgi:hypothetical protein
MSGETYGAEGPQKCFAWMLPGFEKEKDPAKMFLKWGYHLYLGDDGSVTGIGLAGQKLGDEFHFFKAIAEYIDDGSFLEYRGEDDTRWRWCFEKGQMIERRAVITWE